MSSGAPADLDSLISERERLWRAQFALATERPAASARRLLSGRLIGAAAGVVAILPGLALIDPVLPAVALYVAGASLALLCSAYRVASAVAAALTPRRHRPRAHLVDRLPRCSVLVPLRDEVAAVPSLVESLRALHYVPQRLDVLMLVDDVDRPTIDAVEAAIEGEPRFRLVRVPTTDHRSQATALNYALAEVHADLLTIVGARHRPDPMQLLEAADRFASADPSLATLVARSNGAGGEVTLMGAWDELNRTNPLDPPELVDAITHHRTAAVVAARAWDPFNSDPGLDLRLRLMRAGQREEVLSTRSAFVATTDPIDLVRHRASGFAGTWQSWVVDHRDRSSRPASTLRTRNAVALGSRLPLATVRPALVTVSLLLIARPQASADLVDAFPAWAFAPALAVSVGSLCAYAFAIARGVARGARHALAAMLAPLWSLVDACSAVKAVMLLAGGRRPASQRQVRVPAASPARAVVTRV